jgi:hypothetical protein
MTAVTEQRIVANPRGRPKTDRDDVTVKIDRAVISQAKLIAAAKGISLAEYLSDILRGPVSREFLKEMKRLQSSPEVH